MPLTPPTAPLPTRPSDCELLTLACTPTTHRDRATSTSFRRCCCPATQEGGDRRWVQQPRGSDEPRAADTRRPGMSKSGGPSDSHASNDSGPPDPGPPGCCLLTAPDQRGKRAGPQLLNTLLTRNPRLSPVAREGRRRGQQTPPPVTLTAAGRPAGPPLPMQEGHPPSKHARQPFGCLRFTPT